MKMFLLIVGIGILVVAVLFVAAFAIAWAMVGKIWQSFLIEF